LATPKKSTTMPKKPTAKTDNEFRLRHVRIHGHEVGYRMAGDGEEALVLIHGVTGSSTTWREVMPTLAERFTVIAPDLLGHGESAKPRGDYSLGAFASGVRDLLVTLGIERATVVGHSLGGGVAMQMAYQFPERVERLVLVNSGGLGKEVHAILRAVSLPGSELVLPIVLLPQVQQVLDRIGGLIAKVGITPSVRAKEVWRSYTGLTETRGRIAFVHTVRSVIDVTGQRVSARDRLYLAQEVPTLIVWGDRDRIIPVEHAHAAHALIEGSTLRIIEGADHFVPFERPAAFLDALLSFIDATEPAKPDDERFRQLMRRQA
jgi:pimeloyl-ACP methyl ester carboxylesterase